MEGEKSRVATTLRFRFSVCVKQIEDIIRFSPNYAYSFWEEISFVQHIPISESCIHNALILNILYGCSITRYQNNT